MSTPTHYNTTVSLPIDIRYQGISVLIVDDEEGICEMLKKALSRLFSKIDTAHTLHQAETLRQRNQYDLVILDINLPDKSGMDWPEIFEGDVRYTDVIFITGYGNLQTSIQALKLGASDFILKPFNLEQIFNSVRKCIDKRIEKRVNFALQRDVERYVSSQLIGNSINSQTLKREIEQYAPSKATVLVQGESGTGKELVARELHIRSGRMGPFVPVNCGAMDASNLANELFGYTDTSNASKNREGLFKITNGGTLFLDEVSELPQKLQSALLRVLEEQSVRPLGSNRSFNINVRVIAATNKNLKQEVEEGRFRQDLYYRLNVLSIYVSPLRERSSDLYDLIPYFNERLSKEQGVKPQKWSDQEIGALTDYHWPGNVRELRNLIERCILTGKPISHHWHEIAQGGSNRPHVINISHDGINSSIPVFAEEGTEGYPSHWDLKQVEKFHILQVVEHCGGNKTAASKVLKISRKTLDRKFKEWGS